MASGCAPPFGDAAEMREGFLCPLCLKDLQAFQQLRAHYEEEHLGEDRDVRGQLRSKGRGGFPAFSRPPCRVPHGGSRRAAGALGSCRRWNADGSPGRERRGAPLLYAGPGARRVPSLQARPLPGLQASVPLGRGAWCCGLLLAFVCFLGTFFYVRTPDSYCNAREFPGVSRRP